MSDRVAPSAPEKSSDLQSVTMSALLLGFGTLLSRILGLVRDMLTARYFGNDARDAFLNAFRLPNLFRRVFGEGSLSVSFIPVFVQILNPRSGRETPDATDARAKHLVASVFSVLMAIAIPITILAMIFMDDLLRLLLSGEAYMSVPGKFELTVFLARIMFGFLILVSLYAFFMAILNSQRKFALTALAPSFFNLAMIAGAWVSPKFAAPETVLAWSVIVGGIVQTVILLPGVIRSGFFPRVSLKWDDPDTLRVLRALLPSLFGMSLLQLTAVVNMHFASRLPSGTQSYLYLADRILEFPLSLFVVSTSSALLPTLARLWIDERRDEMRDVMNQAIRVILFISLPAALGILVLAQPIVDVLFLGREFKYVDAVATAQVIQIYSLGLILLAGNRLLAQGFYAIGNVWFPALAGGVSLACHILFAYVFTRLFGLGGLAGATVLSTLMNLAMLGVAYNAWVNPLGMKSLLKSFAKFAICGAVMVAFLQIYELWLQRLNFAGRYVPRSVVLLIVIGIAAGVYFLSAHVLKVPEARSALQLFSKRFKRRETPGATI